jgi:hypothetical protein
MQIPGLFRIASGSPNPYSKTIALVKNNASDACTPPPPGATSQTQVRDYRRPVSSPQTLEVASAKPKRKLSNSFHLLKVRTRNPCGIRGASNSTVGMMLPWPKLWIGRVTRNHQRLSCNQRWPAWLGRQKGPASGAPDERDTPFGISLPLSKVEIRRSLVKCKVLENYLPLLCRYTPGTCLLD